MKSQVQSRTRGVWLTACRRTPQYDTAVYTFIYVFVCVCLYSINRTALLLTNLSAHSIYIYNSLDAIYLAIRVFNI